MTQRKDYKLIYDPFLFKESERAQRGKLPIYRFNGETSRNVHHLSLEADH